MGPNRPKAALLPCHDLFVNLDRFDVVSQSVAKGGNLYGIGGAHFTFVTQCDNQYYQFVIEYLWMSSVKPILRVQTNQDAWN